jgi:putative ABC transport system permease protein
MVMARKSAWRKNNRREIKHTIERYLAIMAIIALGTGFYSGLKITKSAMVNSMSSYLENQHMYDYRLLSTLGLTKEDEEYFSNMSMINAQGSVSMDFLAGLGNDTEVVLKAHSITDSINKLNLRIGRLPERGNECVVDFRFFSEDIIGSKIKVLSSNNEDTLDAFLYDEYTVVGIANSVNYLNYDRGTTKLSGGSVHSFVYIPYDGFNVDYYTEILLELDNDGRAFSKKYDDIIADNKAFVEAALKERAQLRYKEIKDEATHELTEAEEKYQDGLQEYLTQKADAENELDKALAELEDAKKEIEKSEAELTDGENKLARAEEDYKKALKDYEDAYDKYEAEKADALALLASQQKEIDEKRAVVTDSIAKIEESGVIDQYNQLVKARVQLQTALAALPDKDSEDYMALQTQLIQTEGAIAQIEASGVTGQYN